MLSRCSLPLPDEKSGELHYHRSRGIIDTEIIFSKVKEVYTTYKHR